MRDDLAGRERNRSRVPRTRARARACARAPVARAELAGRRASGRLRRRGLRGHAWWAVRRTPDVSRGDGSAVAVVRVRGAAPGGGLVKATLTAAAKKKITLDWSRLFPELGTYRPLHLLRRVGPLLQGIALERTSGNDLYRPMAHIHCLAQESTSVVRQAGELASGRSSRTARSFARSPMSRRER